MNRERLQRLAVLVLPLILAGCFTPRVCTTRTETVEIPVPVFIDVPEELVKPLDIEPLPAEGSNLELVHDAQKTNELLRQAQDDRAAIRKLNDMNREGEDDDG